MLRLVDLSLDIYDKAPTFWPDPKTAILPHLKVENMNYNITQVIMSSHLGTHADAPFHFFDRECLGDQCLLDQFVKSGRQQRKAFGAVVAPFHIRDKLVV